MKATIQSIFLIGYGLYENAHRLPEHVREAAHRLMACRTSTLGGHVQACLDGHVKRHWFNSCKHRMCPLCAFTQIERWLAKQKARLLNTAHFHVVFTISNELHELWRLNRRLMSRVLFKSATETLVELLEDPKHLGAKVEIIASLHTWSRKLTLHPHLHCLVSAGGLRHGEWVRSSKTFLLSFGVVRAVFRGKYLHFLSGISDRIYTMFGIVMVMHLNPVNPVDPVKRTILESAGKCWVNRRLKIRSSWIGRPCGKRGATSNRIVARYAENVSSLWN